MLLVAVAAVLVQPRLPAALVLPSAAALLVLLPPHRTRHCPPLLQLSSGLTFEDSDGLLVSVQKPLGAVLEEGLQASGVTFDGRDFECRHGRAIRQSMSHSSAYQRLTLYIPTRWGDSQAATWFPSLRDTRPECHFTDKVDAHSRVVDAEE